MWPATQWWHFKILKIRSTGHYNVISPDDVILRIFKCHNGVPGLISYVIGDQICIKSETNRVKIAQMGNFFFLKAENGHFLRHYDVICPDDVISSIFKCHHCVPDHISYEIGDQICIKIETNSVKIEQMCYFFQKGPKMAIFDAIMTSYLQMT